MESSSFGCWKAGALPAAFSGSFYHDELEMKQRKIKRSNIKRKLKKFYEKTKKCFEIDCFSKKKLENCSVLGSCSLAYLAGMS